MTGNKIDEIINQFSLGTISKIKFTEECTESTILQMIGFFVPKKPINCKFVDLRLFIAEFKSSLIRLFIHSIKLHNVVKHTSTQQPA